MFRAAALLALLITTPALAEPYASALGTLTVEVGSREVIVRAGEGANPCGFSPGQELFRGARAGATARGAMTLCQVGPRCALVERADAVLGLARRGDVVVMAIGPPTTDSTCPRVLTGPLVATRTRAGLEERVPQPLRMVVPEPGDACSRAEAMRADALRALKAKELGQAAGTIAAAVELCPSSRRARLSAGEVALARGRSTEAEAIAERLIEEAPLDPGAHALLSRALERRAPRRAEARSKMARYLDL
jgi:hypothetical protein